MNAAQKGITMMSEVVSFMALTVMVVDVTLWRLPLLHWLGQRGYEVAVSTCVVVIAACIVVETVLSWIPRMWAIYARRFTGAVVRQFCVFWAALLFIHAIAWEDSPMGFLRLFVQHLSEKWSSQ